MSKAIIGVPLRWDQWLGYQCPTCGLRVAVPESDWVACPSCPPVDVMTAVRLRLKNAGFDVHVTGDASGTLRPLLEALAKGAQ